MDWLPLTWDDMGISYCLGPKRKRTRQLFWWVGWFASARLLCEEFYPPTGAHGPPVTIETTQKEQRLKAAEDWILDGPITE